MVFNILVPRYASAVIVITVDAFQIAYSLAKEYLTYLPTMFGLALPSVLSAPVHNIIAKFVE